MLMPRRDLDGSGAMLTVARSPRGNSSSSAGAASSGSSGSGAPRPSETTPPREPRTGGRSYCGRRPRRPRNARRSLLDDVAVGAATLTLQSPELFSTSGRKSIIARANASADRSGTTPRREPGGTVTREIDQPESSQPTKARVEIERVQLADVVGPAVPAQLTWMAGRSAPRRGTARRAWTESQPPQSAASRNVLP